MDIRHAVRYLRKQKGWTQAELAEHAHTTNGNISNLENGQQGYSPSLLTYLSQAFGCSVSQIFVLAEHLEREARGHVEQDMVNESIPIELLFMQLPLDVQKNIRAIVEDLLKAHHK